MQEVFDLNKLDSFVDPSGVLSKLESGDRHKLYATSLNYLVTYYLDNQDHAYKCDDLVVKTGFMPTDISTWPLDKNRQPMDLLLEIKLKDRGPFKFFLSKELDSVSQKARSWFYIHPAAESGFDRERLVPVEDVETRSSEEIKLNAIPFIDVGKFDEVLNLEDKRQASIELFNELKENFESYNQSVIKATWAEEDYFQRARIARQKAAFYANGVSYSAARAIDRHFNHLIEESKNWFVLYKLRENSIQRLSKNEILFCIKYDDFRSGDLYRGRLIVS